MLRSSTILGSRGTPPLPESVGGLNEVWLGDLDEMVERRRIRAVVAFNHTSYFLDGARQRGLANEALQRFEKTGRETVQCVANIYKYYVAYSRIVQNLERKGRISSSLRGDGP
jgi:hypothetical protein